MGFSSGEKQISLERPGVRKSKLRRAICPPRPQERSGRIPDERGPAPSTFRAILSSRTGSAARCHPTGDAPPAQQTGMTLFAREQCRSKGRCRAFQGEFHSLPGKTAILEFEISCATGQRREDGIGTPCTWGGGREEERQVSQGHHGDESLGDDTHTWFFILWSHCQQESLFSMCQHVIAVLKPKIIHRT